MSQSYTTQMDAARKGILTPQMEQVLADESISKEELMEALPRAGLLFLPISIIST